MIVIKKTTPGSGVVYIFNIEKSNYASLSINAM